MEDAQAIVLVGTDAGHLAAIAAALGSARAAGVLTMPEGIEAAAKRPELDRAAVVVVDLDARRRARPGRRPS